MSAEILTVPSDSTVEETLRLLVSQRVTGLPVVDSRGKMVGLVSEFDILKQISSCKNVDSKFFRSRIKFTKKVESVKDTTPLEKIVERFITKKFRRLPVVDSKGKLLGIITRRDLMRVYYYRSRLGTD